MSNMLTTIVLEGRPASDPELATNPKTGGKYVRLTVMQNKGYTNDTEHAIPFTCFFNGAQAERLINAKVQHGNLLTIVGDFDSKEYMRTNKENPNEQIHDRSLEINVSNWSYTPQNRAKEDAPSQTRNVQGQAAQGTAPNYAQNTAPAQQNYSPQQAQNYQQPPAGGYQQQATYQPPTGAGYNQGPANGFANVPQEPLPFHN